MLVWARLCVWGARAWSPGKQATEKKRETGIQLPLAPPPPPHHHQHHTHHTHLVCERKVVGGLAGEEDLGALAASEGSMRGNRRRQDGVGRRAGTRSAGRAKRGQAAARPGSAAAGGAAAAGPLLSALHVDIQGDLPALSLLSLLLLSSPTPPPDEVVQRQQHLLKVVDGPVTHALQVLGVWGGQGAAWQERTAGVACMCACVSVVCACVCVRVWRAHACAVCLVGGRGRRRRRPLSHTPSPASRRKPPPPHLEHARVEGPHAGGDGWGEVGEVGGQLHHLLKDVLPLAGRVAVQDGPQDVLHLWGWVGGTWRGAW